ncbi:unnamed protein product [Phaedon cochleariae]|uniref:Uncharacterized protein n=1 Tax=Phaedon cochleariae TaxID=80249 RepID=A0A9N9SES3_PHACE|nr:unnamed protein product [Phaedon cochleariae]
MAAPRWRTRFGSIPFKIGALQVLMTIARFLPSTEIEISRITKFAAATLKDRRKRVRQAALETLATVASLSSNAQALEIVDEATRFAADHQYLMNVVRTRLSRRQLPTIENDGTIRYSSPRDQTEYEWLLGEKIYSDSSPSSASSSHSMNYWSRNSRHVEDARSDEVFPNRVSEEIEPDIFHAVPHINIQFSFKVKAQFKELLIP